jgi:glycosyltransferase involved in cell wall biosynthesis
MGKYPVKVIRNGVDLDIFKPTVGSWIKDHGLERKKIVLGVAGTWAPRKGLSDLLQLDRNLSDEYQVIIVGVNRNQKVQLPSSVIGIERTYDSKELAELYTAAYVFVNPTYEDNFPNVNIEALACGTPVITYETGGCPELITDGIGKVVPQGDIKGLCEAILSKNYIKEECINMGKKFDRNICYRQYIDLYEDILK